MNVPTIGGARGIFEIFVPGIFLLLNFVAFTYLLPFADDETKTLIIEGAKNPTIAIVVSVSFGYLIGILLRLFRTDLPDKVSVTWLLFFRNKVRRKKGFTLWATEEFPYIGWIGQVSEKFLSPEAHKFYKHIWEPRKGTTQNKQFFNFCKVLISSEDERSAVEIYAAEALSRYIAGMFHALGLGFILLFSLGVIQLIFQGWIMTGLVAFLVVYLVAIGVIINYFRFIRIKEVEIVFAASYRNKELFGDEIEGMIKKKTQNSK